MKCQIVYIKGHEKSEQQAKQACDSFKRYSGWGISLVEGLTPTTVKEVPEFSHKIIEQSRLHNFKIENINRYHTKLACAINHILFWKKVVEANEPMAFIEHDAICIDSYQDYKFQDYLILNAEHVFRPPNKLGLQQFKNYNFPAIGVQYLPENYPLKYHRENTWKDSFMVPGTGAYAITPSGAKKMLNAIEKHGLDQSDFMLNSYNLKIQYILPSPIKFNRVNLSTSYGV